jgi:hypothetical protein
MVNQLDEQQQHVKFIEMTIDEPYALVTWTIEDLRGDAILLRERGSWRLINIRVGIFGIEDFGKVHIPLEIAQRMHSLHHEKLGY